MKDQLTRRALSRAFALWGGMLVATRTAPGQEQKDRHLSPEQKKKADEIIATLQQESKVVEKLKDQYDAAVNSGNAVEEKRVALEIAKQIKKMNVLTEQFGDIMQSVSK